MDFELGGVDPDKLNESKFERPVAGKYHMLITGIDSNEGDNSKSVVVDMEVLAGSVDGQEGKTIRNFMAKQNKNGDAEKTRACQGRLLGFAVAAGLITLDQIRQKKEAGERIRINFDAAVNRTIMQEVRNGKDQNGNPQTQCAFECFHVNDPKVEAWPKNPGFLTGADAPASNGQTADNLEDAFAGAGF